MIILTASAWEIGLTIALFVLISGGFIAMQVWSQRRRSRGEEASTSEAEGADAIVHLPH